jgi:hypothetical protein
LSIAFEMLSPCFPIPILPKNPGDFWKSCGVFPLN